MPAFGTQLDEAQIAALADWIYTPVVPAPRWSEADIRASRIEHHAPGSLPDKPAFEADMMNLFIVVEGGDHHVSVLDGDRMERIHRFPSRYALHGGPKFTPDGRYVFFASRDGWISKFDIWNLKMVAEVRAGINDCSIINDSYNLDLTALEAALAERLDDDPAARVQLRADSRAEALALVALTERLRAAGVECLLLITVPEAP